MASSIYPEESRKDFRDVQSCGSVCAVLCGQPGMVPSRMPAGGQLSLPVLYQLRLAVLVMAFASGFGGPFPLPLLADAMSELGGGGR